MNHLFFQVQLAIFLNVFFNPCKINVIYVLVLGEGEGILVLQETYILMCKQGPL